MNDIQGFILAGGASARMGRRKASLRLGDRTLIQITRGVLSAITGDIYVVGEKDTVPSGDGLEWIPDIRNDEKSSLLGLATALTFCKTTWAFVLACDLPFVTPGLVERIASLRSDDIDAAVPVQPEGRFQPLCAVYRRAPSLDAATKRLGAGNRSLHSLIDHLKLRRIEFREIAGLDGAELFFTNINTQEDLEHAKKLIHRATP